MRHREYDESGFAKVRRQLIREKGSDFQKTLLNAVLDKENFRVWLDENLKVSNSEGRNLPCYPEPITVEEFREPTRLVEQRAFQSWTGLTHAEACRASFWGYVTASHINNDIIEPHYLALNGQRGVSGRHRIHEALKSDDPKLIDDVTRTIIRRFSSLPEARGGLRSISVNCTFARAWWREKIFKEVVSVGDIDEGSVSRVLRLSQDYWEKLITMIISKNSVLGDERVRTALIRALANHIDDDSHAKLRKSENLDRCIRRIGIRSAWQELGVFEIDEIRQIIDEDIFAKVLKF